MNKLSVVVPSRNGMALLEKFLPAILRESFRAGGEVTVVDDCSTDNTRTGMAAHFPDVTVLSRTETPGFCHAVNLGMSRAQGEYLLLLNNDTVPGENSFRNLVLELEKSTKNVAAVVPGIIRPDGSDDGSYRWAFHRGLAVTGENIKGEEYPSGACALWRREAWEKLGGLSCIYAPIYWEDTDMGVRMHKAGYLMKRCPCIEVKHLHAATMGSSKASDSLRERNRFIFMDNNCREPGRRFSRAFWLPFHLLRAIQRGNRAFISGYREYLQWKWAEN
jgi:GT2 family glycosyltransferase